ncbi:putative phage-associated protein [Bacteroidales bacterium Barb6XT]|nr:putative phage-associated protein [Bacteroidales bacterium Barb6XT]
MENTALSVAYKIIDACTNKEMGDFISNLKLQKMLYYMQGFHLAFFDKPLFKEDIVAWQYGPVVPNVYRAFSAFGTSPLSVPDHTEIIQLGKKEENMFRSVTEIYGQFSAVRLMDMTHSEPPWKTTDINDVISLNKLKRYFLTQIEED